MSYLGTAATAVATAVTTTALVLPLLSWSPRNALYQFLQGTDGGRKRPNSSSLSMLSTLEGATDSMVALCCQHAQDEASMKDHSWMAEQFVNLLMATTTRDDLPDYKRYCAFMALLHAMRCNHMQELKEQLYEKTCSDAAMAEEDAEGLLEYFHFATWSGDMEDHGSFQTSLKRSSPFQDRLRRMGYHTVQQQQTAHPGRASHFMMVNYQKREVLISITYGSRHGNGQKWIAQAMKNATTGRSQAFQLSHCGNKQQYFTREDFLYVARAISECMFHMIEHLFIPNGFRVIICGHSLGAGVACLLGVLWKDCCCTRHLDLNLHVYAFGPPPCLSRGICDSSMSYISTIINNHDCIPRLSATSLTSLGDLLVYVDQRLKMFACSPKDMPSAQRNVVDLRKMNPKAILSPESPSQIWGDKTCVNADELHIPGNIFCIWNHSHDACILGVNSCQNDSPLLKNVLIDETALFDHSVDAYRANLELLVEQIANTI